MITNISFDLWLTLIKSHPEFKLKRAEMIADSYNPKGLRAEQIDLVIRDLDKTFDLHNETYGGKIPASEMYLKILIEIGNSTESISIEDANKVRAFSDDLFIEYCPQLLNSNVFSILEEINKEGLIMNLASNTGYIEGTTLRIALDKLNILNFFSFHIFSDEINASKPSPIFFQKVYDNINTPKKNVLHVGDNIKTDYKGAIDFGFSALLIKPNYTLNDIRTRL
ncbi:HAD family hydrolase [Dysgonomonas sp. Marseille-P4677]|uniref:HAD family hydrolase n=1 Tax=Dysgonomonas sp. Marseille-P4677 TaxID=2364790 RepID=UPI001912A75E|nr:HAD family hydrolase [Dysgonomonas sp. Marseille-P4677]MBK5720884.1 HAD family hydrolase [Dysgonomonas sp. Marseille-P4677]